tara:strand:- start:1316 stop:2137 length:822 start_codon:yes stop_codon:yes gene_type:complete
MAITLTLPVVGGDENTWGTKLNTALTTVQDAVNGTSGTLAPDLTTLTINGTDVTTTAAELNIIDGDTSATSTTLVGADQMIINDNGTMKQVTLTDLNTYISANATAANNATVTISAGNALTGGGSLTVNQSGASTITLNHQDTSSQGSVNNSGSTYIQDITLDDYGHVTGITSTDASSTVSGAPTAVGGNRFQSNNSYAISVNGTVTTGQTVIAWGGGVTSATSISVGGSQVASGTGIARYVRSSGGSTTFSAQANHYQSGGSGFFEISFMVF